MALHRRGRDLALYKPYGSVEVADVTGAGDTVIAAFTLALRGGGTMEDAGFIANVAGGIKVGKRGTATVSAAELRNGMIDAIHGVHQST
jgi:D-beta-D-heptose 7-phosphate kinase/D-beta-D-heptose 1-phosphate adenosyltransferase